MNRQEVKDYINAQEPYFLQVAKHKGYVCPECKNGTGKDGDGITRANGKKNFKCFKCGLSEDIFGLIGKHYGLTNFKEQYEKGCELYNVTVDAEDKTASVMSQTLRERNENETNTGDKTANMMSWDDPITDDGKAPADADTEPAQEEETADYTEQFKEWNDNINVEGNAGLLYLQDRGLSLETINRFNVGFIPEWKHPKTEQYDKVPHTARVIIPTGQGSYLARDIRKDKDIPEEQQKYKKSKVGKVKMFNVDCLQKAKGNVFIVEGEIDAMSIIEAGGQAVGLGMAGNKEAFVKYVKEHSNNIDPALTFTILPDHDDAGIKCANYIHEQLKEQGRQSFIIDITGRYKDASELLEKNPDELKERVADINIDPAFYLQNCGVKTNDLLQSFVKGITEGVNTPAIPTGFENLDELLDGGLYEDFYILMAGTGHGKTAFILQVADNIAKQGKTVLFYNLEMATYELMSRSISRETFELVDETCKEAKDRNIYPKSARDITDGARYDTYNDKEKNIIYEAIDRYSDYCDNIIFHEVLGYFDTDKIDAEVNYYRKKTGQAPVVIVDYLQMLSLGIAINSDKKSLTERQAIDKAILDLKTISRRYKTPVIALSSVNREASKQENKELKQEAGKESGNIEYTAGTLMSLDYTLRGINGFTEPDGAKQDPREMKIFIHKNRYGVPKQETFLFYKSKCSYFWEDKTRIENRKKRDEYL